MSETIGTPGTIRPPEFAGTPSADMKQPWQEPEAKETPAQALAGELDRIEDPLVALERKVSYHLKGVNARMDKVEEKIDALSRSRATLRAEEFEEGIAALRSDWQLFVAEAERAIGVKLLRPRATVPTGVGEPEQQ